MIILIVTTVYMLQFNKKLHVNGKLYKNNMSKFFLNDHIHLEISIKVKKVSKNSSLL